MQKKTAILTGVLLLSGCAHVPYNHNRALAAAHVNCTRLKQELNTGFHRHTPGSPANRGVSPSQRASDMHLYQKDCE